MPLLKAYAAKHGGTYRDIFYHEDHEGREDKEKSFVLFVVIDNKIALCR